MVIIENKLFTLTVSDDGIARSLIVKETGEECLHEESVLFSLTQERPYNNEIKLIYPNKRTTFAANRIRREGNTLYVGFELISIEAVIELQVTDAFIGFTLTDFIVPEDAYGVGCELILPPPVAQVRMLQLAVIKRRYFGNWLNVVWDDRVAVAVVSTNPCALPDAKEQNDAHYLYADSRDDVQLIGSGAALVVSPSTDFLDCIDDLETFYGLPRGVQSRRDDSIDASIYWTDQIDPTNVDTHVAYAKKCGFGKMTIYISAFGKGKQYSHMGDYDFNERYPNGAKDLQYVINTIKAAGIVPGLHLLHSHIGLKSRYITPVADHRLNLTRHFTLARDVSVGDDVIYVEENPQGSPLNPAMKILKWNGELIHYDAYTSQRPYCFTGCQRGHCDTTIKSHEKGAIGGVLDVTEFGGSSVYIDERTSLQEEIADKIAAIYNLGFKYVYFDGSEGVNPPFAFNIPYAQYTVYKKLKPEPLFCEGAAKSHFGWHMLSGGNAFDVFPVPVFKEKIVEYPLAEAPLMAQNFTRLNFGWWMFTEQVQPDTYEFGCSKAAAYNCAATVIFYYNALTSNPRGDDVFEVLRRWEDVKRKKWLTSEQKEQLKAPDREHILLVNEEGEYELVPYFEIKGAAHGDPQVAAFQFERRGKAYAVCWHRTDSGKLKLGLDAGSITYEEQLGGAQTVVETIGNDVVIPLSGRRYLSTTDSADALITAFKNAEIVE